MIEVLALLQQVFQEVQLISATVREIQKTRQDRLNETWIDGQVVMQTLHISKRTLQNLRDNGTLPFSRIQGKFYYKIADIESLLESNYEPAKD